MDDNLENSFSTFNPCDVIYNMRISSQNLMMMAHVMNMMVIGTNVATIFTSKSIICLIGSGSSSIGIGNSIDQPSGCRTVFNGGLPENITEVLNIVKCSNIAVK